MVKCAGTIAHTLRYQPPNMRYSPRRPVLHPQTKQNESLDVPSASADVRLFGIASYTSYITWTALTSQSAGHGRRSTPRRRLCICGGPWFLRAFVLWLYRGWMWGYGTCYLELLIYEAERHHSCCKLDQSVLQYAQLMYLAYVLEPHDIVLPYRLATPSYRLHTDQLHPSATLPGRHWRRYAHVRSHAVAFCIERLRLLHYW